MIEIVDNYLTFGNDSDIYFFDFIGSDTQKNKDKKSIANKLEVKLFDYKNQSSNNTIFQVSDKDKQDDDLIISILNSKQKDEKDNDIYIAKTGNYIGRFKYNKIDINIKSRFSDTFLKRMLNFANDVYLDTSVFDAKEDNKNDLDYSKFIIYYMFIQKLEKAFLLSLPKAYKSINHHEMKVRGKIDINRFIKYDIPFKGKISSTSREQKEIQEIIDVVYKAITIIEKKKFSVKNISHIKTHLKQHRSNKFVSNETIQKALKSKALQNPIFAPYKKVLEYANFIINNDSLEQKANESKETYGFLVNVAELFEIYLVKLLRLRMPDWDVIHEEELELYSSNFYARKMKPDIVMKHRTTNEVMVFDTKYKRMLFRGKDNHGMGDLDRSDFFQINTYMTYYNNQSDGKLIAGGLLYPIESNFEVNEKLVNKKSHSDSWLENNAVKFIVDGIDLSGNLESEDDNSKFSVIREREDAFIERIKKIIEGDTPQ